jgi:hypothetical protein
MNKIQVIVAGYYHNFKSSALTWSNQRLCPTPNSVVSSLDWLFLVHFFWYLYIAFFAQKSSLVDRSLYYIDRYRPENVTINLFLLVLNKRSTTWTKRLGTSGIMRSRCRSHGHTTRSIVHMSVVIFYMDTWRSIDWVDISLRGASVGAAIARSSS